MQDKKHRVTLTTKELHILAHILRHFSDYMAHDDRPDHGLGILKGYRDLDKNGRWEVYTIMGKINRLSYKVQRKEANEIKE